MTVFETHGLGYGEVVYKDLLLKELSYRNIKFTPQALVPINAGGQHLKNHEIKWPLINNLFICGTAVRKESTKLDIIKMKNYLKAMNLPIGLLVHYGKDALEIYGVAP